MAFIKVVGGLLVSDQFAVSIPHPDPCWVIETKKGDAIVDDGKGKLYGFSTQERVRTFLQANAGSADSYVPISYTWDELVDKCELTHAAAIIDSNGKSGLYQSVPLRKGI